jgi:hypothetical protein
MQGYQNGMPLAVIRSTIEGRYRPHFPTMTPTPPIK